MENLAVATPTKRRRSGESHIPPPPPAVVKLTLELVAQRIVMHVACLHSCLVSSGFCSVCVSECFPGASLCMKLYECVNIVFPLCQCTSLCTAVSICLLLCMSSVFVWVCVCISGMCVYVWMCVFIYLEGCVHSDLEQDNSPR